MHSIALHEFSFLSVEPEGTVNIPGIAWKMEFPVEYR